MTYACKFQWTWICMLLVGPLLLVAGALTVTTLVAVALDNPLNEFDHDSRTFAVLFVIGVNFFVALCVAVVWILGTCCEPLLKRIRALDPLCCVCVGRTTTVRSIEELQSLVEQRRKRRDSGGDSESQRFVALETYLTPVGGGWSFFLAKKPAPAPRVIVELRGPCGYCRPNDTPGSIRFFAGSTILEVLQDLKRRKLTLASTPSHDTITLGGWVGGCAHGTGGNLWTPTVGRVTVIDQETGLLRDLEHAEWKKFFGASRRITGFDVRRYIIVEIETLPVDNVWTQLVTRKLKSEEETYWWLVERSRLRCIFTGRRGSLMMLWINSRKPLPGEHVDPHCCSRECRYFQSDLLSVLQSARAESQKWFAWPVEPRDNWDGRTPLSNANRFSPTISALGMAVATFFHNFEVFVRIDEAELSPVLLTRLLRRLQLYHMAYGGRTETRFGVYRGKGKLFVDFSLTNLTDAAEAALKVLHETFPGRKFALHPGKAVPSLDVVPQGMSLYSVSGL